jgi:uncharacterized protein YndB with AHSA1/START domain
MDRGFIARQSVALDASRARVWDALVNPETIRQYMFGTDVVSDWQEGSPILFRGQWESREFEDKGVILRVEPQRLLQYSHYSPLSGVPDVPENYHTVTVELANDGSGTLLSLSQDNNATEEERKHAEENWGMMLAGLKKALER